MKPHPFIPQSDMPDLLHHPAALEEPPHGYEFQLYSWPSLLPTSIAWLPYPQSAKLPLKDLHGPAAASRGRLNPKQFRLKLQGNFCRHDARKDTARRYTQLEGQVCARHDSLSHHPA